MKLVKELLVHRCRRIGQRQRIVLGPVMCCCCWHLAWGLREGRSGRFSGRSPLRQNSGTTGSRLRRAVMRLRRIVRHEVVDGDVLLQLSHVPNAEVIAEFMNLTNKSQFIFFPHPPFGRFFNSLVSLSFWGGNHSSARKMEITRLFSFLVFLELVFLLR